MKKYEAVFILDIRKTEDEGVAFSNEFAELVGKLGGKMVTTEAMGRLQFSYEIKKRKAGIYFDFVFEAPEAAIFAIKDRYRLDERILRNMIIVCDRPEKVCGKVKDLKEIASAPAPAPAEA
ncbi:MAG: 30S ribosomal protein S6 [Victivallaceae bacterium]|nr:30S ribosomal protein S6 [Victivallaceae bacterium]